MKCEEVKRLLSFYLDDELDLSSRERISHHLQQCVSCKRGMTDLAKTVRLMQAIEMVEPPRDYWNSIKDSPKATTKE